MKVRTALVLLVMLFAAACGAEEVVIEPTPTPQPPVMVMYFAPPEPLADETALNALEAAIKDRTGLNVDAQTVARDADALAALCDTSSQPPASAWVGSLTLAAALAETCGLPVLQIARPVDALPATTTPTAEETAEAGEGESATETPEELAPDADTPTFSGVTPQIIANTALGTGDLTAIRGRVYCRISYTDAQSWLIPTLIFAAQGVDLESEAARIDNYETSDALIEAVAAGTCDMASIPADIAVTDKEAVTSVYTAPVEFPFGALVYPVTVGGGERIAITNALRDIAEEGGILAPLLGTDVIIDASLETFEPLMNFISQSGYDLAALGK